MEVSKKGSGTVLGVEHTEMKKHDPALKISVYWESTG